MESLELEAAREFFYRGLRLIERGAGHARALGYSIPLGFCLWIVRDSADVHPDLRPSLGDEIMALYYRMKPFSSPYQFDASAHSDHGSSNNAVENPHKATILKFQKPR